MLALQIDMLADFLENPTEQHKSAPVTKYVQQPRSTLLTACLDRKRKSAASATKASSAKTSTLSAKDANRAKEIRAQIKKLEAELSALEKKASKPKAAAKKTKPRAKAKPEKTGPKR